MEAGQAENSQPRLSSAAGMNTSPGRSSDSPRLCPEPPSELSVTRRTLISSKNSMTRLILSLAPAIILNESVTPFGALVAKDHQNSRWCKEIAPSNPSSIVASTKKKVVFMMQTVSAQLTGHVEKALRLQHGSAAGQACSWSADSQEALPPFSTGSKSPRVLKQEQDGQFGQFPRYYCVSPW